MKTTDELLAEISLAKQEAEEKMKDADLDSWDDSEDDPVADDGSEERFWRIRWCMLNSIEDYLLGKTDTLRVGLWMREV
jgi:hypothetical protein